MRAINYFLNIDTMMMDMLMILKHVMTKLYILEVDGLCMEAVNQMLNLINVILYYNLQHFMIKIKNLMRKHKKKKKKDLKFFVKYIHHIYLLNLNNRNLKSK
jgi:hypothetical protein